MYYITIYPIKIYFTTKKWQFSMAFKTVGQNIGKRQMFSFFNFTQYPGIF